MFSLRMALGASILKALVVGELTYIGIGGIVIGIGVVLLKTSIDIGVESRSLLRVAV